MASGARADDAHHRANELYLRGAAEAIRGEHAEAYAAFTESYRLWPRGATLGNLGWAEVELGHLLEGFRHLKDAARGPDLDDAKRSVIQGNVDDVYGRIGHVAIEVDDGARVTLDGEATEEGAPFHEPIDVLPGPHHLEASLGARSRQAMVDAPAGAVVAVDLRVAPAAEDALPPPDSRSSAPRFLSNTPERDAAQPAPSHSWWSLPRSLGVGLGAVALVGIGVGLSFEGASQAAADDARRMRAGLADGPCTSGGATAPCETLRVKLNALHTDETIAHVSLAVGGAAALGAVVAFLVGTRRERDDRSALRWSVGPGGCSVGGEF